MYYGNKIYIGIILVFGLILFSFLVFAQGKTEEERSPKAQCPVTKMTTSCLECHVKGNFRVRETPHDAHLVYPNTSTRVLPNNVGSFVLKGMDSDAIKDAFEYFYLRNIRYVIVEIHSPGGSLFGAQRIISIIQEYQSKGVLVETRVYGFAASAGFLVFVAGDIGRRFVSPQADLMWHELLSLKLFDISTPADKEDEAKILRHLQDIRNNWLASRSKLSKEQIDEKIRKKEFWMSGRQAVEFGFADGFITDAKKRD